MSSHTLRLILPGNDTKTVFLGVPLNTQSAISLTANLVMFIKDYKYYVHNTASNTTGEGVPFGAGNAQLSEIPSGQVSWMNFRKHASDVIYFLFSDGMRYQYTFTVAGSVPTFSFVDEGTQSGAFGGTAHYRIGLPLSGEIDSSFNTAGNQWYSWDGVSQSLPDHCELTASVYGGPGQQLEGLSGDLDSAYVDVADPSKGYAFKGGNYYELSFTNVANPSEPILGRTVTGGSLIATGSYASGDVVKSGRIEVGKEFSASYVSLTHTAFFANPFYPSLVDELRLRGLAVTFGHLLHGHGHSHSGSGNERSRQPHFHVHIDHAKTSTMVNRHNIHYKSMHIPHLIDFQYVYEDDGKPLSDEHARAIGQVVLTLTFEGFTV